MKYGGSRSKRLRWTCGVSCRTGLPRNTKTCQDDQRSALAGMATEGAVGGMFTAERLVRRPTGLRALLVQCRALARFIGGRRELARVTMLRLVSSMIMSPR